MEHLSAGTCYSGNEDEGCAMRLKQIAAKAMVAGGLGLPAIGLGIGVANRLPSQPQVPILPNVPAVAVSEHPTAAWGTNKATVTANGDQLASATTASPLAVERTRSAGVSELYPAALVGVTPVPLRGPLGGLLG
jgi:hypothetical protein